MNEQTPKTNNKDQSLTTEQLEHMRLLADAREEVARRAIGDRYYVKDGLVMTPEEAQSLIESER